MEARFEARSVGKGFDLDAPAPAPPISLPQPPTTPADTGRVKHRFVQSMSLGGLTILLGLVFIIAEWMGEPMSGYIRAGGILAWISFVVATFLSAETLAIAIALWLRAKEYAIKMAEIALQQDLNKDGAIGDQKIVNVPFPVYVTPGGRTMVLKDGKLNDPPDDMPQVGTMDQGEAKLTLVPSERMITHRKLWGFLITSFNSTTESRDGWSRAAWKARGMSPKLWVAIQDFVVRLSAETWKTADPPTLESFLGQFGWTGTDRTGTDRDGTGTDAFLEVDWSAETE